MSEDQTQEKSKRTFSKRLIVANIAAAWVTLAVSFFTNNVEAIITHVFSFVTVNVGIYAGIGHMDYRKILDVTERAAERLKER